MKVMVSNTTTTELNRKTIQLARNIFLRKIGCLMLPISLSDTLPTELSVTWLSRQHSKQPRQNAHLLSYHCYVLLGVITHKGCCSFVAILWFVVMTVAKFHSLNVLRNNTTVGVIQENNSCTYDYSMFYAVSTSLKIWLYFF